MLDVSIDAEKVPIPLDDTLQVTVFEMFPDISIR